jgi:bis(5'-nucleosyl)-tetraphosphatase (symmetrical)
MATYAVGDIQGCYKPLKCLLEQVDFSWKTDKLWVVGDLVNRGPDSLKVLRYLYKHRDRVTCVLGNHDLHLLAVANGLQKPGRSDTLDKILIAEDRDELLEWLRHLPLIHSDEKHSMVHAGIPHIWTLEQAHAYAKEVESALRGSNYRKFLSKMYGDSPRLWSEDLTGSTRLRTITNYLTRMRFVYETGGLDLHSNGPEPDPGKPVVPWFSKRDKTVKKTRLIFGHWASLEGDVEPKNLYATDTGCVWGNALSMYCLETEEWHSCDC